MCGISGAVSKNISNEVANIVHNIVLQQKSRGPDHQAIETIATKHGSVILGHNRLKIIDLSEKANQPMWDDLMRFCITFNGEIYNYLELRKELISFGYQFHTQSDTEVILNAFRQWGIGCLNKLNGAFAFGLYDKQKEELFLCRDRFGKKPLFYCWNNANLFFSSTTAIAKILKFTPNLHYVARGLQYWIYEDDSDISPYEGLYALPSSHYLKIEISNGYKTELKQYYDLKTAVNEKCDRIATFNEHQLIDEIACLLDDAINIRLRADVSIGIALSGGLDSSTIAAKLSAQNLNVLGFTFGDPNAKESEGPLVAKLASNIDAKIHYLWPKLPDVMFALQKTLADQGAPFPSSSVIAQNLIYNSAKNHNIKVILGGQGGDEVFMGYRKFQIFWLQQLIHRKQYWQVIKSLWQLQATLLAESNQIKKYWQSRHRYRTRNIPSQTTLNLPPIDSMRLSFSAKMDDIKNRQLKDIVSFSLPTLLRYEDRNSLGNSVESRLPFMDYRLIELGLALPESLKIRNGYGKWVLRNISLDSIPNEIRFARYKRGFDINLKRWMQQGLGHELRALLQDNLSKIKPYIFERSKIESDFSDERILQGKKTFAEVISLLWLADNS